MTDKNIPSNAVNVSLVYERIFTNLALLNRSSGFCKNQQILRSNGNRDSPRFHLCDCCRVD